MLTDGAQNKVLQQGCELVLKENNCLWFFFFFFRELKCEVNSWLWSQPGKMIPSQLKGECIPKTFSALQAKAIWGLEEKKGVSADRLTWPRFPPSRRSWHSARGRGNIKGRVRHSNTPALQSSSISVSVWNTVKATKMPSGHTWLSTTSALRNRLKQSRLFSQRPYRRTRPPLQRSPGPLGAHTLTQGLATTARVSGEPRRQGRPGALRLSPAVLAGTSFHSPADSALLSRGRAAH